jgi:hypothetical protein
VRQTYRVLAWLIALGVVVQAAAIALGWFTALHDVDNGLVIDKNYEGNAGHALHGLNALILFGTAVRAALLTRTRTGTDAGDPVAAQGTSLSV